MAKVTVLERKFVIVKGDKKIDLPEINPSLSVNGIENDKDLYHFSTIAGTKG